jgi:hypothetical protein
VAEAPTDHVACRWIERHAGAGYHVVHDRWQMWPVSRFDGRSLQGLV